MVGSSVGWAGAGYLSVGCLESLQQDFLWAWGVMMKAVTNGERKTMSLLGRERLLHQAALTPLLEQ